MGKQNNISVGRDLGLRVQKKKIWTRKMRTKGRLALQKTPCISGKGLRSTKKSKEGDSDGQKLGGGG